MSSYGKLTLLWAPRVVCIASTLMVTLFGLGAFEEGRSVGEALSDFVVHLLPVYVVLIGTLTLAWNREWIGSAVTGALGLLFLWWDRNYRHNAAADVLLIAGPLFVMTALYLVAWLFRNELHAHHRM